MRTGNIMICKVCEKTLMGTWGGTACFDCNCYFTTFDDNGVLESETVTTSNYYLVFCPLYKAASVVEKNEEQRRILKTFSMDELTHDLAVKWLEKLKLYVTFQ